MGTALFKNKTKQKLSLYGMLQKPLEEDSSLVLQKHGLEDSPKLKDHLSLLSEGLELQTGLAARQVRVTALFHCTQRTNGPLEFLPGENGNHPLSRAKHPPSPLQY